MYMKMCMYLAVSGVDWDKKNLPGNCDPRPAHQVWSWGELGQMVPREFVPDLHIPNQLSGLSLMK